MGYIPERDGSSNPLAILIYFATVLLFVRGEFRNNENESHWNTSL